MRVASVLILMSLVVLAGCTKPYTISTELDSHGNKHKVVTTNEVKRDWSLIVGSDMTIVQPKVCPFSALDW